MKKITLFSTRKLSSRSKLKRHRTLKVLARRISRHTANQRAREWENT